MKYKPKPQTQTPKRDQNKMRNQTLLSLVLSVVLIMHMILSIDSQTCQPSGHIIGKKPPKDKCNQANGSDCCVEGQSYTTYICSPQVSNYTIANLTLNGFEKGADGGGPSECDGQYHSDDIPIVALSTGWFNKMKRCHKNITIHANNGKNVSAMVVDECDSTMGCDEEHDYQPPCKDNIVDASKRVWEDLGVPESEWGMLEIHWTDA